MPKRCPECGHPVSSEARACPNCPASWDTEEEAAYRRRHTPSFGFFGSSGPGLLLLAAGGALFLGWRGLDFILTWGGSESTQSPIVRFVAAQAPSSRTSGTAPAAAAGGATPGAPAAAAEAPTDGQDPDGLVMISHDRPSATSRWRFRGRVFDLVTLKSLYRCAVDFTDPATGERFETSTDWNGLYRVELPSLSSGGYAVALHMGGYASSYLDPGTPNVPGMGEPQRRTLARELNHSLDGPYSVEAAGERPVETNFYLAPAE